MARLDEIAEGLASALGTVPHPEPLGVDLRGESPVEVTVLIRAVIDACQRRAIPLSNVHVCPELGADLVKQLAGAANQYEGVLVTADTALVDRIEFYRFPVG